MKNWVCSLWLFLLTLLSSNPLRWYRSAHPLSILAAGAGWAGCVPHFCGSQWSVPAPECTCPFLPERSSYRAENTTQILPLCCCCPWGSIPVGCISAACPLLWKRGKPETVPSLIDVGMWPWHWGLPLLTCAGMDPLLQAGAGADCRWHTRESSGMAILGNICTQTGPYPVRHLLPVVFQGAPVAQKTDFPKRWILL